MSKSILIWNMISARTSLKHTFSLITLITMCAGKVTKQVSFKKLVLVLTVCVQYKNTTGHKLM